MLFNIKYAFFIGLAATAYSSPMLTVDPLTPQNIEARNNIEARAQAKDVDCGGKQFTAQNIKDSIAASKRAQEMQYKNSKYIYPKKYGNSEKFFEVSTQLYEYPLMNPTYTGKGSFEIQRVIMNEKYNYIGSIYHTDDVSNNFRKCVNVEDKEKEANKNNKPSPKDSKKAGEPSGQDKGKGKDSTPEQKDPKKAGEPSGQDKSKGKDNGEGKGNVKGKGKGKGKKGGK